MNNVSHYMNCSQSFPKKFHTTQIKSYLFTGSTTLRVFNMCVYYCTRLVIVQYITRPLLHYFH